MRYTKFEVLNYKGIKNMSIDLDSTPDFKIYAFVGLNESGKTTMLEAMNDCENEVPLMRRHGLIPKGLAGGFTGSTVISAHMALNSDDKVAIEAFIKESMEVRFSEIEIKDTITITREYRFDNSNPMDVSTYTYTDFALIKKTAAARAFVRVDDPESKLLRYMKERLFPEIIFYRDFLTKLPERIYLSDTTDSIKASEYLSIIEDVLTSINPNYDVQKSLIDRLDDKTDANTQALEAVENELGAKISQVVFEAWSKIQQVRRKEIVVKTGTDAESGHYLKLTVKDGSLAYSIAERSLGFRWFFTFLLYTEFRKERLKSTGEILFLLDEPASNLHQAAQKSLLGTFENIVTKSRLAYTTHSHHLINPAWLDNVYIVRNKALTYEEDDDFTIVNTEVEADKYKSFVAKYPTQSSYFQPILDVLDYQPGMLENVPNVVITEGKFDYAAFMYFRDVVLNRPTSDYAIYPGQGASKLDLPIALYESWGRPYIALLDSDSAGLQQQKRYIKEISGELNIFTLRDVDATHSNIATEDLLVEDERLRISQEYNPELTKYDKSAFNTGLRMLASEKRAPDYITEETKKKFTKIFDFIESKFS